jgi:uncharacterized protein (DUF924 family)
VSSGTGLSSPDFSSVIDFWFGPPGSRDRGRPRREWFRKDASFDEEIRSRFLALHESASRGELSHWEATPLATLALTVVLDQFPRNMFRESPRAFSTDPLALACARRAVERGFDRLCSPVERTFIYLPFEHSENLAAQRRSVALFESLRFSSDSQGLIDYAHKHYDIVAKFGRFPHRNAVLGRASTPEETAFLRLPGSGF